MTGRSPFLAWGAVAALLGVAFGAFGAHALKAHVDAAGLAVWQTAVQYHLFHALGLLCVGLLADRNPGSRWLRWSGWSMTAGVVLFSGSLYLLALTGQRFLGYVTPIGGFGFLLGWACLLAALTR
jgi:uncharacterized membrane protein YgdD (TMEM256/DUF423 family)